MMHIIKGPLVAKTLKKFKLSR